MFEEVERLLNEMKMQVDVKSVFGNVGVSKVWGLTALDGHFVHDLKILLADDVLSQTNCF